MGFPRRSPSTVRVPPYASETDPASPATVTEESVSPSLRIRFVTGGAPRTETRASFPIARSPSAAESATVPPGSGEGPTVNPFATVAACGLFTPSAVIAAPEVTVRSWPVARTSIFPAGASRSPETVMPGAFKPMAPPIPARMPPPPFTSILAPG